MKLKLVYICNFLTFLFDEILHFIKSRFNELWGYTDLFTFSPPLSSSPVSCRAPRVVQFFRKFQSRTIDVHECMPLKSVAHK